MMVCLSDVQSCSSLICDGMHPYWQSLAIGDVVVGYRVILLSLHAETLGKASTGDSQRACYGYEQGRGMPPDDCRYPGIWTFVCCGTALPSGIQSINSEGT